MSTQTDFLTKCLKTQFYPRGFDNELSFFFTSGVFVWKLPKVLLVCEKGYLTNVFQKMYSENPQATLEALSPSFDSLFEEWKEYEENRIRQFIEFRRSDITHAEKQLETERKSRKRKNQQTKDERIRHAASMLEYQQRSLETSQQALSTFLEQSQNRAKFEAWCENYKFLSYP